MENNVKKVEEDLNKAGAEKTAPAAVGKVKSKEKKEMGKVLKAFLTVIWYIVFVLLGSVTFILLLHTPLLKSMEVYMYRGTALIIITGILLWTMLLLLRLKPLKILDVKDTVCIVCFFCCINMVVFTLFPVTVERSVSVFLLSSMDAHDDHVYSKEEIENLLEEDYIEKNNAVDKRAMEQLETGSIEEINGGYRITERGKFIVSMFKLCSEIYNCNSSSLKLAAESEVEEEDDLPEAEVLKD
jgi:hypothetical protein